jgi:NADPH:quinone reductase-like Zn-dependent oxidoreductase
MKAVCVKPDRSLEVRDVPTPTAPPEGHVLVRMAASAINHGDHTFLKMRSLLGLPSSRHDIWGASGAGRIVAVGPGVPTGFAGRQVAIYRSLSAILSSETIGLWSEMAQVHHLSCLILPDHVAAEDYSGSLVNLVTAYAFLRQAVEDGHRGIVATAGNSATGRALAEFARRETIPVVSVVRSPTARGELERLGASHVLDATDPKFERDFEALAEKLRATAVFDGTGGQPLARILPVLPKGSTIYCYGFLAGAPVPLPTALLVTKNLVLKGFSNFASATVQDPARLADALTAISALADHPAFRTRLGERFSLDQIDAAMKNEREAKSVLVP